MRKDTDAQILCTKDPGLSEGGLAIEEDAALMSADSRKHVLLFNGGDGGVTVLKKS